MEAKIIKRRKQGTDIPRIHFVPAKNPDAHAEDPAKLGLILLNDPIEVIHVNKFNNDISNMCMRSLSHGSRI